MLPCGCWIPLPLLLASPELELCAALCCFSNLLVSKMTHFHNHLLVGEHLLSKETSPLGEVGPAPCLLGELLPSGRRLIQHSVDFHTGLFLPGWVMGWCNSLDILGGFEKDMMLIQ